MRNFYRVVGAELYKNRRSHITWMTFTAFALAPVMGGAFIYILRDPDLAARGGPFMAKATAMNFVPNWGAYMSLLCQSVGVGGVLLFGFVASWIFGSEFVQGTAKDLLALPVSRIKILNGKFFVYFFWCLALAASNLAIGLLIGFAFDLDGWHGGETFRMMAQTYAETTVLTIVLGTTVAFFAIAGQGYLAPLGAVTLVVVLAQILAAAGFGKYFPFAIPGIYSGISETLQPELNRISFTIHYSVSLISYLGCILWFEKTDQAS
jgi:ABC-type transport system involved in multi-copper enzyme maturation permease subunit